LKVSHRSPLKQQLLAIRFYLYNAFLVPLFQVFVLA
jgi:hypothetical protein